MPKSTTPDAAESNAGDEFHVLWAMRKSLELLNVDKEGLKAVSVEGITKKDEERLTNTDAVLGVDLTEYYGGRDFKTATKVLISQLKYSTRNATKNWTPSELYTGKNHKWHGSIIHRLAEIFHQFYISESREEILNKLKIKLVSNRPASKDVKDTLRFAHEKINAGGKIRTANALIKALPEKNGEILKTFYSAAGLKGQEFIDFVLLFDLTECNTDSRYGLKQKLIEAIIQTGNIDVRKEYNELYQLVKEKTLPEGQNSKTLIITDILYTFGFSDFSELFPARSSLQPPLHLIEREQLRGIVDTIEDPSTQLLLLHAGAGMGKSTMTELILQRVDKAHCVIVFDCYGGGSYLDSDDKRHKPENAFLQLSNELALKTGSPFLITRGLGNDAYLRAFQKRIRIAVQFLKKINPISQIILIIDAADNSVHGADQYKEHSFVQDLLAMAMPDGCKIIVTSRTGRINTLKLPAIYKNVEISPFSFGETKQFLLPSFPAITDEEIEEFRKMTKCTPRSMAYSLDMPGDILKEKMIPLEPDGKSIDDIFKLLIDVAAKRSGDKQAIDAFLQSLIHLPRPVPLSYVSLVSGLSTIQLNDIQTDLWRGVINKNEHFFFRDEDFENFLRSEYPKTDLIDQKIAEAFLSHASKDEYASVHLAMALFNAGMSNRLRTIVLEKECLQIPADPIKNKDVQVERTRLAMKMSRERNNNLDLIKLQMVAAEAAKTNSVLERILLDNAELATSYGDLQMNQRLYFQLGNPSWFGHVHFRSAAIYSRNVMTHDLARQHLDKADDWMDYRRRLPDKDQHDFNISDRDIAYGAEAVLNIAGAARCIEWLGAWKPRDAVYRATEILLHNLLESSGKTKVKKWLRGIAVDPVYQLLITRVFFEYGITPPFALKESMQHFTSIATLASKTSSKLYKDILAFCEYALHEGVNFEEIKPWLSLINIAKPQYVPSFYESSFGNYGKEKYLMDMMFRKQCLIAFFEKKTLKTSDFYPQSLIAKLKEKENQYDQYSDQERRKFESIYKFFLPIYELRIAYMLKTVPAKKLQARLQTLLTAVQQDYEMKYLHHLGFDQILKFMAVRLADIAIFKYSATVIDSISDAFSSKQENNIILYLGLARKVSGFSNYHATALGQLKKVEESIEMLTLPGDEQLNHFTEATLIGGRISLATGKHYFDKMVSSSAVIDIEGQQQISSISKMIGTEENWNNPKLAYNLARFVEYTYESLKGFDHFPWHAAVPAIARLDAASAFSTACRWDHRGIIDYQEYFTKLIGEGIDQNFMTPIQAAAILQANKYIFPGLVEIINKVLQCFDNAADFEGKDRFLKMVITNIKLNFTSEHNFETLDLLKETLDNGKFQNDSTVSEFREFYASVASLLKKDNPSRGIEKKVRKEKKIHRTYSGSVKKVNVKSNDDIMRLCEELIAGSENRRVDFSQLFEDLRKTVKPENYLDHLNLLINFEHAAVDFYSYEKAIVSAIQEWEIYPAVQNWKEKAFGLYLKNNFGHYIANGYASTDALKEIARVFNIDQQGLSKVILDLIPDYLDELEASLLFQLLELTNYSLNTQEKIELLEWLMPRWSEKIKDSLGDGPWSHRFMPPADNSMSMAYFIRYLLGHPDKSNRWRAAHVIRTLVQLEETTIISCLWTLQNDVRNNCFQDGELFFYWISSKLYFWIGLERACRENPAHFIPMAGLFFSELTQRDLPHTLIRLFIQRACLTLQQHSGNCFDSEEIAIISQALLPKKNAPKKNNQNRGAKKLTFRFDTLDTVPYWYNPLAGALNIEVSRLLHLADTFITQKWGYQGDGRVGDPAFAKDWARTFNRHGSQPSVENLSTYFEYHAMFCAAGEVLESPRPHLKNKDDDEDESWSSWLDRKSIYWAEYWLADLRDPTPLESKLWSKARKDDWQWNVGIQDFDDLTLLASTFNKDDIPVWMRIRKKYGKDYETCSVHTALVGSRYAFSALLSLQTARRLNPDIPLEDEEEQDYYPEVTQDKRFRLKGWIKKMSSSGDGLDSDDDEFKDISKSRLMIGSEFTNWARLEFAEDLRFSFSEKDTTEWSTKLETWSTGKEDDRYDDFSTEGERLVIKKKELMRFLTATDQCLLVSCEIDRHVERKTWNSYLEPYCYLYIIYPNGTIKTISRNYKLG